MILTDRQLASIERFKTRLHPTARMFELQQPDQTINVAQAVWVTPLYAEDGSDVRRSVTISVTGSIRFVEGGN